MKTKVFQPMVKVVKATTKVDLGTCLALARRSRTSDFLILCFGIGVGVLFYALVHDIMLRFWPGESQDEHERTCACTQAASLNLSHSHHLLTRHNHTRPKYLMVPSPLRRSVLADEKV